MKPKYGEHNVFDVDVKKGLVNIEVGGWKHFFYFYE
jgi:hypothetical protein